MNLPYLLAPPMFAVLFKWTCLLALAWVAHWVLRRRHARWRLILWRSILCFGLVLPLTQFFEIPGLRFQSPVIMLPQLNLPARFRRSQRHPDPARSFGGTVGQNTGHGQPGFQQCHFSSNCIPKRTNLIRKHFSSDLDVGLCLWRDPTCPAASSTFPVCGMKVAGRLPTFSSWQPRSRFD